MMREITNFLFNRMAGIWGGKVDEPADARVKYARVNELLVKTFEDTLSLLESGQKPTNQQVDSSVKEIKKRIRSFFS